MKNFFYNWLIGCSAVLIIPSIFMTYGSVALMAQDGFDGSSTFVFACAMFFSSMLAIGMIAMWPALFVLAIGLAIHALKNSRTIG